MADPVQCMTCRITIEMEPQKRQAVGAIQKHATGDAPNGIKRPAEFYVKECETCRRNSNHAIAGVGAMMHGIGQRVTQLRSEGLDAPTAARTAVTEQMDKDERQRFPEFRVYLTDC